METRLEAEATDAFTQDWSLMKAYTSPPPPLLPCGTMPNPGEEIEGRAVVLVIPICETQSWYPLLLEMSVDCPRLLPSHLGLLTKGETHHPVSPTISRMACLSQSYSTMGILVQAKNLLLSAWRKQTSSSYCMSLPGDCGVAAW